MTVETYAGPTGAGAAAYTSKRFTAKVNGTSVFVHGRERSTTITGARISAGALEASFLRVGTTETITVEITRLDPVTAAVVPITSAVLRPGPERSGASVVISGGKALVTVPPDTRLFIETNGSAQHPFQLFTAPLRAVPPVGAVDYTTLSSPTSFAANSIIRFPAGVHTLSGALSTSVTGAGSAPPLNLARGLVLNSGCKLYLEPGAVVIGNFDAGLSQDVEIHGPGVLAGAASWTDVSVLNFEDRMTFAPIFSRDHFNDVLDSTNNVLKNVTILDSAFYNIVGGISKVEHVAAITPWYPNTDFGGLARDPLTLSASYLSSYCFVADDAVILTRVDRSYAVQRMFSVTVSGGCLAFGFWAQAPTFAPVSVSTFDAMHLGLANNTAFGPPAGAGTFPYKGWHCGIRWWCDGEDYQTFYGRYNVQIDDFQLHGPCANMLLALINAPYPADAWGGFSSDRAGTTGAWFFRGLVAIETPGQRSLIEGRDRSNTPCALSFAETVIGGARVDRFNFQDFFTVSTSVYSLYVDYHLMTSSADLCNAALALIGHKPTILSVEPSDGSPEADACARFFGLQLRSALAKHSWAFATKRATLTALTFSDPPTSGDLLIKHPTWAYAYPLPADMLSLQMVLPPGVVDEKYAYDQSTYAVERPPVSSAAYSQYLYSRNPCETIVYTTAGVSLQALTPNFVDGLIHLLASYLASVLITGPQAATMARELRRDAEMFFMQARTQDARQRQVISEDGDRGYASVRNGTTSFGKYGSI